MTDSTVVLRTCYRHAGVKHQINEVPLTYCNKINDQAKEGLRSQNRLLGTETRRSRMSHRTRSFTEQESQSAQKRSIKRETEIRLDLTH